MDSAFTYFLYALSVVLLCISFIKDKKITKMALKKAWNMFLSVLPQFLSILLLMGLLLAIFDANTIRRVIGAETGIIGMLIASLLGSIALVPVLIAFPIATELLNNGAGIMQIAVFISTLTTVGIVTIPIESKYLGKKAALWRNALFFIFSFFVAWIVGMVLV